MTKLYRILGKRGRITIPYEIRKRVGFSYNDILSFAEQDDRTVIVRREKLCNDCRKAPGTPDKPEPEGITLLDFLDSLSAKEQRAALIHLSVRWAEQQGGPRTSAFRALRICCAAWSSRGSRMT